VIAKRLPFNVRLTLLLTLLTRVLPQHFDMAVTYAMCDIQHSFSRATKAFCSIVVENKRPTGHR
jgi:hypothetical protein